MKEMICKHCGKKMFLDDVDFNFSGNKDNYWLCDCGCSAVEMIRYGKSIKVEWDESEVK